MDMTHLIFVVNVYNSLTTKSELKDFPSLFL